MSVLYIRAGLTVEVEHLVPAEHIILDLVVREFLEYDGADADLLCDLIYIYPRGFLFFHDLSGLVDCCIEYVFKEDDSALTRRHHLYVIAV